MKKLIFILPFAVMIFGSCLKSSDSSQVTPISVPVGTFAGQFRKIHRAYNTGKLDTSKIGFNVIFGKDTSFKVTADTSTIHAGSYGKYQISTNFFYFIDATYPKKGTPAKIHLSGSYSYYFDGNILQIANISSPSDSIFYQYDLKRLY